MESITPGSVLLFPLILVFFGGFVYGVAFGNGLREHTLPRYRWAGVAILALAVYFGTRTVWLLVEPGIGDFYRAQLGGRKVVAAHYVALALPLVGLAAVAGLEAWFKRYRRDML